MLSYISNKIKRKHLEKIYKPEYFIPLSVLFVSISFFSVNDIENSRSVIGAIIQSLASILAIAISLTLVAVQLSAQNYSTRILSLFTSRKNKTLWMIIILYLISIIYSIFLLKAISYVTTLSLSADNVNLSLDTVDPTMSILFNLLVSLSILLAAWCILLIPKYILIVLEGLSPEFIVKGLSERINKDHINFEQDNYKLDPDPLLPLTDIILAALRNSDNETIEQTFFEIKRRFFILISNKSINQKKEFIEYILYNMEMIKDVAILKGNIRTIGLIIDFLEDIGIPLIIQTNSFELIREFLFFVGNMSKEIVKADSVRDAETFIKFFNSFISKYYSLYKEPMDHLNNMWFESVKKIESKEYLKKVWVESKEEENSPIEFNVRLKLFELRREVSEKGLLYEIKEDLKFLLNFGSHAIDYYPHLLSIIVESIDIYSENLFNEGFDAVMNQYGTEEEVIKYYSNLLSLKKILNITEEKILKKFSADLKEVYAHEKECYIAMARLISVLKILGIEAVQKNKYGTANYQYHDLLYFKVGEIIRLDFVVIEEIIMKLQLIASRSLDYDNYIRTNFRNVKYADKIAIDVISALEKIGVVLINKKSPFIEKLIEALLLVDFSYNKYNLKIITESTFESLDIISNQLIIKEPNYIVPLGNNLGNQVLEELENGNINHNRLDTIIILLERIGSELSRHEGSNKILKYLFINLNNISKALIEKELNNEAEKTFEKMQSIVKNMQQNKFEKDDIKEFLGYFESIKEFSEENSLYYPKNIDKWVSKLKKEISPQNIINKYDFLYY